MSTLVHSRLNHTPYGRTYCVLGVPILVMAEDMDLLTLADEELGPWGDASTGPARCHVTLRRGEPAGDAPPQPVFQVEDGRLEIMCPAAHAWADQREEHGEVAVRCLENAEERRAFRLRIESVSLFLAHWYRPVTLHAAGVVHERRCILLSGEDGAGKSTLAYACLRAGMGLLAEDVVFAEGPSVTLRVYGSPWKLHLLPDATRFFPELGSAPTTTQLNGETKIVVNVAASFPHAPRTTADVAGVLSVVRSEGAHSRIMEADTLELVRAMTHFKGDVPVNSDLSRQAAQRLLNGPTARLEVGNDPHAAVSVIRRWAESLS